MGGCPPNTLSTRRRAQKGDMSDKPKPGCARQLFDVVLLIAFVWFVWQLWLMLTGH